MQKIINPGTAPAYNRAGREIDSEIFCKIEIKEGRLSISGVIGPLPSGDARGSCGQIDETLKEELNAGRLKLAAGWDLVTFQKFLEVWDKWHLNDMRAACEHQRAAGWQEIARERVKIYTWTLKPEYIDQQKALEAEAVERMTSTGRAVETFKAEEARIVKLPYSIKTTAPELAGWDLKYYQPARSGHIEEKARGWLSVDEDERGILSKPCEVCGYKYGSSWLKEELPPEVIEFIGSLPETSKTPAWV